MSPQGDGVYSGGFREEVLNVFLAILLNERDIVSVPENIRKISNRTHRIPDIIITEFWGVRVIIEGRIFETQYDESSSSTFLFGMKYYLQLYLILRAREPIRLNLVRSLVEA